MNKNITDLNFTNFESFLNNKVVLVDFWAEWCHPCKLQHKVLEDMIAVDDHGFEIARLNVDDNKFIASKLGVRNIPTLILYRNGEEIRRIIGLQTRDMIVNQVKNALANKKSA